MSELRQVTGHTGNYRNPISHHVDIIHTPTHFLRKDAEYTWTESHQRAFPELKDVYKDHPY